MDSLNVSEYYFPDYASYDDRDLEELFHSSPCRSMVSRTFVRTFGPMIYLLVLALGVAGNATVVAVICRQRGGGRPRPATDTFLLHLAASDLLLACTLPFWTAEAASGWRLGAPACKAVGAVFSLNLYGGIFLLVCISVERYLAIVHALDRLKRYRPSHLHLTCALVWGFCALLASVDLYFRGVYADPHHNETVCALIYPREESLRWSLAVRLAHQVLAFLLPTLAMVYCYCRIFRTVCSVHMSGRRKTLKVVVAVVLVFLACWAPYNAVLMADTLRSLGAFSVGCRGLEALDVARSLTHGLGLLHSCLNPLIYAFVGVRFRGEAAGMLRSLGRWRGSDRARGKSRGKRGSSRVSVSDTSTSYSTLW